MIARGIVIIGAGKVGRALARRLTERGFPLAAVYNRTPREDLRLSANVTSALDELPRAAGLYLLSVSDDAIEPVARKLKDYLPGDALVAHTSGATPLEAVTAHFPKGAIFYPLQSFTPARQPDWSQIPICLSANDARTLDALRPLAEAIGGSVHVLDDAQRRRLHLAAVFANNFTNYCYHVASELLKEQDLPFDMLIPLIRETTARLGSAPPARLQTGPAIRGDRETIRRHLDELETHEEWQKLYRHLTRLIERLRDGDRTRDASDDGR